ncbi:hypothetical protein GOP47_0023561, partial [Adiantum capillus-veneris]
SPSQSHCTKGGVDNHYRTISCRPARGSFEHVRNYESDENCMVHRYQKAWHTYFIH